MKQLTLTIMILLTLSSTAFAKKETYGGAPPPCYKNGFLKCLVSVKFPKPGKVIRFIPVVKKDK